MSLENVKNFLRKYHEDIEFRKAIDKAPDKRAKKRIAKEAGYEFTMDELEQFLKSSKSNTLTEDDLNNVVGGTNSASWFIYDIYEVNAAKDVAF